MQRFDKLSLFDKSRHVENGFDINFWKFIFISSYKPSKFWNSSSDNFSEKGPENMPSGTQKARAWVWRHLRSRSISARVLEGRYDTFRMAAHYGQDQKEPYSNNEEGPY